MYEINNDYTFEYIIKKSKFIVKLIKVDNSDIDNILYNIKNEYPKATHYCYAYVLKNYSKYSDDGEPSGTAGLPILNALNSRNVVNVLCVVIRYFGGIKFGASGLLRTYGKVVRDSIDLCNLSELIDYKYYELLFDYDKVNNINNIIKDYIIDKSYDELITYKIKIPLDISNDIINNLNNYNITIREIDINLK